MIRRLSSTPLRVLLRRSFILVYVLMGALGAASFASELAVTNRLDVLVGSLQPLAAHNATVLTDLVDAETGLRGFELTGQTLFLQPYYSGLQDYPRAMNAAEALARGDRSETSLLVTESQAAQMWIDTYAAPRASGQVKPSTAGANAGKTLLDRFRATNAAVSNLVQKRIAAAQSQAHLARDISLGVLAGLLLLTIAAGTYTGLRLLRRVVPPLEEITRAIMRLAAGYHAVSVTEQGTSELVDLAQAVKHLDQENSRRHTVDRRRERLRLLTANVAREMSEHLDLEELLDRCASIIATAFNVQRAVVGLTEGDEPPQLVAEWCAAGLPTLVQLAGREPTASALLTVVAEMGDRQVVVSSDPGSSPGMQACFDAFGAVTVLAAGAAVGDDCKVMLGLLDSSVREWSDDDLNAVQTVTADVAAAIHRAQLFAGERQLVRDLEALDRAKADFVATVSHELRTPLTSIRGYVEMLRDGSVADEGDRERMLGIVERNTNRLQVLVDELLTLSRIEAGTLGEPGQPVDIDSVLNKAAATVLPQAELGGVALGLDELSSGATVLGDPGQLEQVALNLLSNAVKFTPAGGRVTVSSWVEDGRAVFAVTDTGIGIPEEEQDRIGGRFFRASNATARAIPGTGLGIRIVRGLVDHHGGTVELDSGLGRGTTWTVRLPAADVAARIQ